MKPKKELKTTYSPQGAILGSKVVDGGLKIDGITTVGTARQVLDILGDSFAPAPAGQIEEWLAELDAITAKAKMDGVSAMVQLSALTRRLEEFPQDIVHDVLCVQTWKFFPTWADLEESLSKQVSQRKALIAMIERKLSQKSQDNATVEPEERTPDRKARIAEITQRFTKRTQTQRNAKQEAGL